MNLRAPLTDSLTRAIGPAVQRRRAIRAATAWLTGRNYESTRIDVPYPLCTLKKPLDECCTVCLAAHRWQPQQSYQH